MRAPLVIATVAFLLTSFTTSRVASAQNPQVIVDWNQALLTSLGTPGVAEPTVFFTRPLALLHVAIFDAVNTFDRTYTPYIAFVDVPSDASRDVAAAASAHAVLSEMYPSQRQIYDARLARHTSGVSAAAAANGTRVGVAAARAALDRRANDGWNRPQPSYVLPSVPGFWQPTPPQNAAATFGHYPNVAPFVIGNARSFLVAPPPALTTERYATDFNEVKAIGSATSTTRTADQTLVARLFAAVGTTTSIPALWSNLTRDLARSAGMNGVDTARLFALTAVTFHDALYTSFYGKFLYGLWRPVTAIRDAERDGNAATVADPNWLALIPTPPYPTYPGNYACLSSAITTMWARAFGRDNVAFSATWTEANGPGWTRNYSSFSQLAEEASKSRVYGGIHFNFDTTASFGTCSALGEYVYLNTFRRGGQ
jgi:hypothetical protein